MFRIRLRTLLVLVAIVGVGLGTALQTTRRARYCQERARFHQAQSASLKQEAQLEHHRVRLLKNDLTFLESSQFTQSVLQASGAFDPAAPEQKQGIIKQAKQEMVGDTREGIDRATRREREHQEAAERHAQLGQEFERAMWRPWLKLPEERD